MKYINKNIRIIVAPLFKEKIKLVNFKTKQKRPALGLDY
jgi:hypothetical protein